MFQNLPSLYSLSPCSYYREDPDVDVEDQPLEKMDADELLKRAEAAADEQLLADIEDGKALQRMVNRLKRALDKNTELRTKFPDVRVAPYMIRAGGTSRPVARSAPRRSRPAPRDVASTPVDAKPLSCPPARVSCRTRTSSWRVRSS